MDIVNRMLATFVGVTKPSVSLHYCEKLLSVKRPPASAPSRGWVGGLSRMSGRPPRYTLTRRKGRPASMLHFVKQCEAREA